MDKKYMMAGLLVVIVIAVLLFVKNAPQTNEKTGCDWRPPKDYQGVCMAIAGYYFNGNSCVSLSKCVNDKNWPLAEKIPFESSQECFEKCT